MFISAHDDLSLPARRMAVVFPYIYAIYFDKRPGSLTQTKNTWMNKWYCVQYTYAR
jgi:hypothetical protein